MKEIYTKAIVLSRKNIGEADAIISLFTEELGKVVVKAKSIRKITSKLSAHFQPLSFVKVRMVASNSNGLFLLIDGITDDFSVKNKTKNKTKLLSIIDFLDEHLFEFQKDDRLWHFLIKIFSENYDIEEVAYVLLSILGFHPQGVQCSLCKNGKIRAFHKKSNEFLCDKCALKFTRNDILYIKSISKKNN